MPIIGLAFQIVDDLGAKWIRPKTQGGESDEARRRRSSLQRRGWVSPLARELCETADRASSFGRRAAG